MTFAATDTKSLSRRTLTSLVRIPFLDSHCISAHHHTDNVFAGIEVSQAAFTFIYRFMSNKSAEYPEGVLNKNVLKSFMSYSGPENNLTHTPGYERIPDNWYKRNPSDEYSIPYCRLLPLLLEFH